MTLTYKSNDGKRTVKVLKDVTKIKNVDEYLAEVYTTGNQGVLQLMQSQIIEIEI